MAGLWISLLWNRKLHGTGAIQNPTALPLRNLVLTEIFPSGWEILNTRFMPTAVSSAANSNVSYQDIRDDRVCSYVDPGSHVLVRVNFVPCIRVNSTCRQ